VRAQPIAHGNVFMSFFISVFGPGQLFAPYLKPLSYLLKSPVSTPLSQPKLAQYQGRAGNMRAPRAFERRKEDHEILNSNSREFPVYEIISYLWRLLRYWWCSSLGWPAYFCTPLVPVTFSDPPEYQVLFRHQYNAV
jgi:hypothetical protein